MTNIKVVKVPQITVISCNSNFSQLGEYLHYNISSHNQRFDVVNLSRVMVYLEPWYCQERI